MLYSYTSSNYMVLKVDARVEEVIKVVYLPVLISVPVMIGVVSARYKF
mgnify:CR=1 FL=1